MVAPTFVMRRRGVHRTSQFCVHRTSLFVMHICPTTLGTILPQPPLCFDAGKKTPRSDAGILRLQLFKQLEVLPLDLFEGHEVIAEVDLQLRLVTVKLLIQEHQKVEI